MVKYWINNISRNIKAELLKLGTIKETKWHPKCCCHSNSFCSSLFLSRKQYPHLQPLKWDKGCYLEQTQFPYCLKLRRCIVHLPINWKETYKLFCNWKEEAWKNQGFNGIEPMTSAIPVRCSTNWAMKPHIGSEVNLLSLYLPWWVKWREVYMK